MKFLNHIKVYVAISKLTVVSRLPTPEFWFQVYGNKETFPHIVKEVINFFKHLIKYALAHNPDGYIQVILSSVFSLLHTDQYTGHPLFRYVIF